VPRKRSLLPRKVITQEDKKISLSLGGGLFILVGAFLVSALFDHFGRLALARPTLFSAGMVSFAIAMRWKLRRYAWFWGTMICFSALHVALILFFPWTTKWVPALAIIPLGTADLYLMLWVLAFVRKIRAKPTDTRILEGMN